MPIQQAGSYSFDTTTLTTSGFSGGPPCGPGAANLQFDGFWQFTVPAPGLWSANITGANFDAELSAHQGSGCSAVCVGHSGDVWYRSVVLDDLSVGDTILLQVGSSGNSQGWGTLDLRHYPDPCDTHGDDMLEDNDSCGAAKDIVAGTYLDLLAQPNDPDYYSVELPPGQLLTVEFPNATSELGLNIFNCTILPTGSFRYTLDRGFQVIHREANPITVVFGVHSTFIYGPIPHSELEVCALYDMVISVGPDPCAGLGDDGYESNDTCNTAPAMTNGVFPGLVLNRHDDRDCFELQVSDGQTVSASLDLEPFHNQAILMILHEQGAPLCGTGPHVGVLATGTDILWWQNDTGANATVVLEIAWKPNTFFGDPCEIPYSLTVAGSALPDSGEGSPFCVMNTVNSTGQSAVLSGMEVTTGSGFHSEVKDVPPGELGYILVGSAPLAYSGVPLGNGFLCLQTSMGNLVGRYNVPSLGRNSIGQFDTTGVLQNLAGTSTVGTGFDVPLVLPHTGDPLISAGETHYFQAWFRDTSARIGQSNTTNGLAYTF